MPSVEVNLRHVAGREHVILLYRMADRPINQTAELTPAAWANRNASVTPTSSVV